MNNSLQNLLSALKQNIKGAVYIPSDEEYAEEIAAFNTAIHHTPDIVVSVASGTDIQISVQLAKQYGFDVTCQATGHGAYTAMTSGLLISTRHLNQVSIDPDTSIASIGAGARWQDVIPHALEYNLAPISGSSSSVGVVGYLLGGGLGPLARSHGFSSDYVESMKVVTGSGELIDVNEHQQGMTLN